MLISARMKGRWWGAGLMVRLSVSGCGSDGSSPDEQTVRNPNATLQLNDDMVEFRTGDYELAPGDEKYLCWTGRLPADRNVAVREIAAENGPGTHHTFLSWTFLQDEPEGMTECPVSFKTTWIPIFVGGVATSPLRMPEGAAVDLERGKQLVLQLHLQTPPAAQS